MKVAGTLLKPKPLIITPEAIPNPSFEGMTTK